MMIKNKYPDFTAPDATNCQELIKAGAFIPLDNYWDDYPNIKALYTDVQWDRMRQPDGHIYYIPLFSSVNIKEMNPTYSGEAFWVQVKVREWANYPELKTPDDFFDLIESYLEANPTAATDETYYGRIMKQIDALKHKDLPLIVMSEDFDSAWAGYVEEYGNIDTQVFFGELTAEVARRCG